MSLIDTFAFYRHEPLAPVTFCDDVWAIPVRVDEEITGGVRFRDMRMESDEERLAAAISGAHPWLRAVATETEHVRLITIEEPFSIRMEPDQPDRELRLERHTLDKQGAWIEDGLTLYQLRIEPYWELIDSTEAEDAGLLDPGVQKDIQVFLDAGFEGWQMQTARRGITFWLEELSLALWQLPGYVASLHARRLPSTACVRAKPDSDQRLDLKDFVHSAQLEYYLKGIGMGWVLDLFEKSQDVVVDLPPDSPLVPEGVDLSYGIVSRLMRSRPLSPPSLTDHMDIQPRLGRPLLVPGLYPEGWQSPRVPYRSLRHAWAQLIEVYGRFGLDYATAPEMPPP